MIEINKNELSSSLLAWYDRHARILPWRDAPTPYRVWISEIMLQQTRVDTVKPYFERFVGELPELKDLAEVSEERLMKLWEGLGYYSRARNLKKAAMVVMEKHNGVMPGTIEELLALPGIGPYTSGAVGSIAFGLKAPAVDGNVYRVMARLTANKENIGDGKVKKQIEALVVSLLPDERVGDYNQALMELGATVCLPNGAPKCGECPVRELCEAYRRDLTAEIPFKLVKSNRRIEEKTVFIISLDGKYLLRKRPSEGLLSGLWEFPNVEGVFSEDECADLMNSWGIRFSRIVPMDPAKHIFSHIEWHMVGYRVEGEWQTEKVSEESGGFERLGEAVLVTKKEIREVYSIPTAFKAYRRWI